MPKRSIDVTVAALLLLLGAPLAALIALLIKLETPGPILTSRRCIGRHGKPFTLYHFRTMITSTTTHQPIRTLLGRLLCNYSLNDYPMLWSVLKGDMSCVGPRPHTAEAMRQWDGDWRRLWRVKPGLIGPALLALRERYNQTDHATRMALENHYLEHHTLYDDLRLVVRGVRAMVAMGGHIKGKQ